MALAPSERARTLSSIHPDADPGGPMISAVICTPFCNLAGGILAVTKSNDRTMFGD